MANYDFSMIPGDYVYGETANGKYAYGVVQYGATSERNSAAQRAAGGEARQQADHGGHLIAHCLGGRNDESNLDAQNANVNQRGQRHIENQVAQLAQDSSKTVFMSVENYSSNGQRPDAAMITVAVRDNTTGQIDVENYSLQNASYAEQAEWEALANENAEIDPRQDIGMTPEQRALANDLAEAEMSENKPGEGHTVILDSTTEQNTATNNGTQNSATNDGASLGTETTQDGMVMEDDGVTMSAERSAGQDALDDGVSLAGNAMESNDAVDDGASLGSGITEGVSAIDDGASFGSDAMDVGSSIDDGESLDGSGSGMEGSSDGGMDNDE